MTEYSLGRLQQFDPRSRNYPIRELVKDQKPRSYSWPCKVVLDQGNVGACVGFSVSHEIAARPAVSPVTYDSALGLYHLAQTLDDIPGTDYEGTSVLAGMKAATRDGYYGAYRWAFSLNDVVLTVGHYGPVVLGMNWYESMFSPDKDGYLQVDGDVAGGHAILCRGVSVKSRSVLLHNSWGESWGDNGTARLHWDDLDRLLGEQGEAAVPERRYVVEG